MKNQAVYASSQCCIFKSAWSNSLFSLSRGNTSFLTNQRVLGWEITEVLESTPDDLLSSSGNCILETSGLLKIFYGNSRSTQSAKTFKKIIMSYGHILKLPILKRTQVQKLQSFQLTSLYYENKPERETNLGSW